MLGGGVDAATLVAACKMVYTDRARDMYVIYMHLEIAVEDAQLVQVVRGQYDLGRVENSPWVRVGPAHQIRIPRGGVEGVGD